MIAKPIVLARPDMIVSYPNNLGQSGRYSLIDHRDYFRKFSGGSLGIFQLALVNVLDGDLLNYVEQCDIKRSVAYTVFADNCDPIFDNTFGNSVEDNTMSMNQFAKEAREFNRRIFDVYRYAKTSVSHLGIPKTGLTVVKIHESPKFDSGAFLIK